VAISNPLILPYKIAALRLLPWIPKALAMLVGQALACMQKMQEHFSVAMTVKVLSGLVTAQRDEVLAMTVIYELISGPLVDFYVVNVTACLEPGEVARYQRMSDRFTTGV